MRIEKFQNRRHRHICMDIHPISYFSTGIDEPAAARLQDYNGRVALTDAVFIKRC